MTFSIRTDRQLIRARARSNRYVLAQFTAPAAPRRETRRPVNVAFVLDRSGSMAGENKLSLAREAIKQSLRMLREEDRFSIVVYDDRIDVLTRSTFATRTAIRDALDSLSHVNPRNSTDLFSGWMHGCDQVAEYIHHEQVTRVLLLTDGLANHGVTNPSEIVRHASELRQRGVSTSTFGVGADFDERFLRDMAHAGGGNSYFLSDARQIPDLITSELGESLEVVMPSTILEVEIPRGADAEVLNTFRSSTHDSVLRVELGDLVSSQEIDVVIRMNFARGDVGQAVSAHARLYSAPVTAQHSADLMWCYETHQENDRQMRDRAVDRRVAAIYVARARADATEANRRSDFAAARRAIEGTVRHIREYAGDDPEINNAWMELEAERPRYDETLMDPLTMKGSYYVAEWGMKSRSSDGRARRSIR